MALDMERRLNETAAGFIGPVHALRGPSDQRGALIVLVENQHEVFRRVAVFGAELIDPLDRLKKDPRIEAVSTA